MFIFFLLTSLVIYGIVNYGIVKFGNVLFYGNTRSRKIVQSIYTVVIIILSLSFFIEKFLDRVFNTPTLFLYVAGSIWIVICVYLLMLWLTYRLILLFLAQHRLIAQRRTQRIAFIITVTTILGLALYQTLFPNVIRRELTITIPTTQKTANYTILFASDLHLDFSTQKSKLPFFVDKMMGEQPDFIFLGGDVIDNSLSDIKEENVKDDLKRITNLAPTYMVYGNHDDLEKDTTALANYFKECGIHCLRDSVILIDSVFLLIGRKDKNNPRKSLEELRIPKNFPTILLDHRPSVSNEIVQNNIDLSLSGHTHNGQFFPLNVIMYFLFDNPYGYRQKENSHFNTSSGIGKWGYGPRIGTVSEYIIIHLRFTHQ